MNNSNLLFRQSSDVGTIREIFFANQLSTLHKIIAPKVGDFLLDNKYIVEVAGKNKSFKQIKDVPNSFVVVDEIEVRFSYKIPLCLFRLLY
jgi:hypothetical protein